MLFSSFFPDDPSGSTQLTLENYVKLFSTPFYLSVTFRTLYLAGITNIICLLVGFPVAYFIAKSRYKGFFMALTISPLMVSALIQTFGWMVLLGKEGIINKTLITLGLVQDPIKFLFNFNGLLISYTQILLPFMILSLVSVLGSINKSILEASQNMGAGRIKTFFSIILPLSMPGILAGSTLVLAIAIAIFVTASLLGGAFVPVLSTQVYLQMDQLQNWHLGSAMATVMIGISAAVIFTFSKIIRYKYRAVFE
jgi:putative spermidine/putrescine transport system permease protein